MDRYDPNDWTTSFVRSNTAFCLQFLQETNAMVVNVLRQGNYPATVAGLDRILNGMITIYNAGAQTDLVRFIISTLSMVESHVIAFGLTGGDPAARRKNAIACLEDACDFADRDIKKSMEPLLRDLYGNKPLDQIRYETEPNFPADCIGLLEDLHPLLN